MAEIGGEIAEVMSRFVGELILMEPLSGSRSGSCSGKAPKRQV